MSEATAQDVKVNLYKISDPLIAEVESNTRLTPASRPPSNDVRHVVLRFDGKEYPYVPGQSVGIIPPGVDEHTGKPHRPRLYSIASPSEGDDRDDHTVSVCVVRHFWEDPKAGPGPHPGLASNYICDLKPGDKVKVTGPVGKHFVLPGDYKKRDFVFIATGTGIAPYRGMLKFLFNNGAEGNLWLFFGVAYNDVALYDGEFESWALQHQNFHYVKAVSREESNPVPQEVPTRGDKMYVQVRMYQEREKLATALNKVDSMVYLCGLKGMEQGIYPVLEKIGQELGVATSFVDRLRTQHRLRVEVY